MLQQHRVLQRTGLGVNAGSPRLVATSRPLRLSVRAQAASSAYDPKQGDDAGTLSSQLGTVFSPSRGEEARRYFRTVYDFPNWERHRRQWRMIDRLLQIPQSHILQNILPSLAWVGGVATLVVAYMHAFANGMLPANFPSLAANAACTAFITNTSMALSLLLVFRTNAGYGRWDEARKMWGGLLNRTRDTMRMVTTLFPDDATEAKKAMARWMVAYARVLRIHFQPEVTLEGELKGLLRPDEIKYLSSAPHRPVRAIQAIAQIIQSVNISPIHQQQMSQNLTFFHDVLGGCERLLRAPIPVSYTRHTARFLFFWLTLLPFALVGSVGVWTIPVCIGISAVLCGIEEIGVQCEEPFGILPLEVICNRIQADVMNTLKDDEETKATLVASLLADGVTAPAAPKVVPPKPAPAPVEPAVAPTEPAAASSNNGTGPVRAMAEDRDTTPEAASSMDRMADPADPQVQALERMMVEAAVKGGTPEQEATTTPPQAVAVSVAATPVVPSKKDPNAPEQANPTGTLSSQSGNVIQQSRSEAARKYWRTVYDFPNWEKHRSQYRLIERLLQVPQSHIMQNILPSIAWVTGVASLVVAYNMAHDANALPDYMPALAPNAAFSAFITNTSVALSLLLVFRTNASYGRWDEARKMWGGLLNRSRDIMRQGATLFPEDPEAKKALARWMVAFARALRIHFQPEVTLESELKDILKPEELKYLAAAPHRPVRAIHAMSQVIQNTSAHPVHQYQMSTNLTYFHDVLGGCERLLRAPIPVSYTRHTARYLFVWLTVLPFALYGSVGAWTIPLTAAVATVLCGIEEIGVQCEEPFGILPLDVICNRIQADVMNTLKDDEETSGTLFDSMDRASKPVVAIEGRTVVAEVEVVMSSARK